MTRIARDRDGVPVQALALGASRELAIMNLGLTQTAARLLATTLLVRLQPDVDCRVAFGPQGAATASATSTPLTAGQEYYFRVPQEDEVLGGGIGVAVWGSGGAGSLNITEMR
jgi:hypothetical protein